MLQFLIIIINNIFPGLKNESFNLIILRGYKLNTPNGILPGILF